MYLISRFSPEHEKIEHPLISQNLERKNTEKLRIMSLKDMPTKDELQKIVAKHYEKNSGEIVYFGKIKFYEFYEHAHKLLYRLDIEGNIIKNYKLFYMMNELYSICITDKNLELLVKYEELYLEFVKVAKEAINSADPIGIAFVAYDEYASEYDIIISQLIGRSLNKSMIFQKVKKIFDMNFGIKEKNDPKYKEIARKIFDFYIEKKKNKEWK